MATSVELLPYLEDAGLEGAREEDEEIHSLCPAHESRVGRPDRNPSFWFNTVKGIGFCFSCGWRPSFSELVRWLTGRSPDPDIMIDVTEAAIIRKLTERKKALLPDLSVHQWTLDERFKSVPDRLLERRHLLRSATEFFGVRFDYDNHCWVLPLRSPSGTLLGWQQRQKGSVSNYPKDIKKSSTLFGVPQMLQHDTLALVESPLDAVRLWQCDIPAVSSMGVYVSNEQVTMLARHATTVVVALDDDQPGRQQTPQVMQRLRRRGVAVTAFRYGGRYKDPGDYESDDDLRSAWHATLRYGL